MKGAVDLQIRSILEMADRMITISEQGFLSSDDDGCLLLNGMVRECAYRLRDAAERERESQRKKARPDRGLGNHGYGRR